MEAGRDRKEEKAAGRGLSQRRRSVGGSRGSAGRKRGQRRGRAAAEGRHPQGLGTAIGFGASRRTQHLSRSWLTFQVLVFLG